MFKILTPIKGEKSTTSKKGEVVIKGRLKVASDLYKQNSKSISSVTGFIGRRNGVSIFCAKICPFTTKSNMPDTI
jgi:hypothetical protein